MDHETICEFHGFCTSSTDLPRDDNFTTFGVGLHDETENTIACTADGFLELFCEKIIFQIIYAPTDSKTTEQLVSQALALCDGRETTVLNFLSVKLERVLGELETFLNERSQLTNAASFLSKNLLRVCSTDDNLA